MSANLGDEEAIVARPKLKSLELCAGAGGQALGLEQAGYDHVGLVELEGAACETLRLNRPDWNIFEGDLHSFDGTPYAGIDLLAAGVPCPPFSKAGKQLGRKDERDLFPEALRVVQQTDPRAVLLENVRGLLDPVFEPYRNGLDRTLRAMGYTTFWQLLRASDYGVSQLRPRTLLIALKEQVASRFEWPEGDSETAPTVGVVLYPQMASRGWRGARAWRERASKIAPTLVGGSKKHGGPDLGPTRAKRAWAELGVDGKGLANEPPAPDFVGMPRLTVEMTATLQGFPPTWRFAGKKTPAYRQIGNAFPPPVARAVGAALAQALEPAAAGVVAANVGYLARAAA